MAHDPLSKLRRWQEQAAAFLRERGLEPDDAGQTPWLVRCVHFWLHVGQSFLRNRCPARASALAYTTLLALVPLLAVGVSVTTSLLQKQGDAPIRQLIDQLVANVAPALNLETKAAGAEATARREEVVQKISGFIGNIHSGALGLTSTLALVFVAIGLLRTIEATFNDIWGVPRGRGWLTSIVQYWAAITLGPIVLVLAVGLTSGPYYQKMAEWIGSRGALGSVVFAALPFVVLSLGFALLYQLMPHTKVRWPAALAGGIVGGCLWQLNNKLSVTYVASAVSYSKIYGSLGLLPLFLAGLYFSWLILLFGAQVAYAYQNRRTYLQEKQSGNVHQLGREFVALRLMTRLAGDFQRGEKPSGTNELGAALAVPTRLVSQILQTLLHARLVVEVSGRDTAYAPARPLDQITLHDILHAMRAGQGAAVATRDEPARARVRDALARIQAAERDAAGVTLLTLVTGTG